MTAADNILHQQTTFYTRRGHFKPGDGILHIRWNFLPADDILNQETASGDNFYSRKGQERDAFYSSRRHFNPADDILHKDFTPGDDGDNILQHETTFYTRRRHFNPADDILHQDFTPGDDISHQETPADDIFHIRRQETAFYIRRRHFTPGETHFTAADDILHCT